MLFSRSHVSTELGDSLDEDSWNTELQVSLEKQISEKNEKIKFLRSADFADLIECGELSVTYDGEKRSFDVDARKILKSELAYQLVRSGYISRNYTLYTSTFYSNRVSSAAMNFIIHHVQPNLMDIHFELKDDDVDAILREQGKDTLNEPGFYNITILDRLIETDAEAADNMIASLNSPGEQQREFLQAYLTESDNRLELVTRFAKLTTTALIYLVSQTELDDVSLIQFVDTVLSNLSTSKKQDVDKNVIQFLQKHYAEFSVLTEDRDLEQIEKVAEFFDEANIVLPSLKRLSNNALTSFVSRSLYDITYKNLALAIGETQSVALDVIRTTSYIVYNYVLDNLDTYLSAIDGVSVTVDNCENFVPVLNDILIQEPICLAGVVKNASPECRVFNISEISVTTWQELADYFRFPETFDNVSQYVEQLGIDTQLAQLLTQAGKITEVDAASEDQKLALAKAILAAREKLPEPELRVNLVLSMELNDCLDIESIEAEEGRLFPLLLKHNLIKDDENSYRYLAQIDWSTRKSFILESKQFVKYMNPQLLQADLTQLLLDDKIDEVIKRQIVEQSERYAPGVDLPALTEIAKLASQYKIAIPADTVKFMAEHGVLARYISVLFEPLLDTIKFEDLKLIMNFMGEPYSELTTVGRTVVRVPNTPADCKLLEYLKTVGIVNSYTECDLIIKVNRKRK